MAGIRLILQRRKAADSVRRITRTMEMISTARYKSYQNKRNSVVEYHDALAQIGYLLVTPQEPIDHPLLKENNSGNSAILAVGSSRGLCGAYNSYVSSLVDIHIRAAKDAGKTLDIYATESRLTSLLHYHNITPKEIYPDLDKATSGNHLDNIAEEFVKQYMAGKIDSFNIVYMRYYSASCQQAQTLTILPLTELIDNLTTRATVIWPWGKISFEDFILSPAAFEIIKNLAKTIVRSSIESCLVDAAMSEYLARMIAMRNATDNAEDMIKELTNDYNYARQSQITGELLDIVSGTGALQ
ncbi:MAG: ATP synthase F1 subunit gamma [Phycisphaerae bacterium]